MATTLPSPSFDDGFTFGFEVGEQCPPVLNLQPSRKESAFWRRKNDERVEGWGTECKLFRFQDIGPDAKKFDAFDDAVTVGKEPSSIETLVIIEPYQQDEDIVDSSGKDKKEFPFVATMRFRDDAAKGDIVEIAYEFARAAGLIDCYEGDVQEPTVRPFTRYKLVNRVTSGINSDMVNKFFIAPSEEVMGEGYTVEDDKVTGNSKVHEKSVFD